MSTRTEPVSEGIARAPTSGVAVSASWTAGTEDGLLGTAGLTAGTLDGLLGTAGLAVGTVDGLLGTAGFTVGRLGTAGLTDPPWFGWGAIVEGVME